MSEPVIELRDAVCVLGSFPALAGADLDVAAGEVVLLRGPNGAGKSTVLRACAGLLPLRRGRGRVLGCDLGSRADRRRLRRRVGLLGHESGLYDELTVAENLRFWARLAGVEAPDVRTLTEAVGLEDRLDQVVVGALSAGQRRRTQLATVLARRPELWLLDEPHAGLDPSGRDRLDELVRRAAEAGATVVVVSHEGDRVAGWADRELVVHGGRIDVA